MSCIAENLANVNERIAAASERRQWLSRGPIWVVAVTKGRSVPEIQEVLDAGVLFIGENRVQETQAKYGKIRLFRGYSWHLIGHLQRNKVKPALEIFSMIHSVDSVRLLAEIARCSEARGRDIDVLIQVNTTGEASKYGIEPEAVLDLMENSLAYPRVRVLGLMTMGKLTDTPEENRPAFASLRELADKVTAQRYPGIEMRFLSMGMTNDFEIAVEEGANLVRIGRAIFEPPASA